jgi:hypothetical protein
VKQQEGFFLKGVEHLRPLTLKTIAEAIEMHESTVSRVTSNKYLSCDRGVYELKYFFTSGVASSDGGAAVSAEAVKSRIKALIAVEAPDAILKGMPMRPSGRAPDEMRAIIIEPNFTIHAEGSVLVSFGDTKVLVHRQRGRARAPVPARQGRRLGDGANIRCSPAPRTRAAAAKPPRASNRAARRKSSA